MAKPIRFTPQKTEQGSWRLNIPSKFSETGKRQQFFYATKQQALDAAAKLREQREVFGTQATAVSPSLAEAAVAAEALLQPLGIGLLEAVSRFVEIENRIRASVPIEQAIAEFRARKEKPKSETKKGRTATPGTGRQRAMNYWSRSQATAYRLRGEKLIAAFPGRMIATITGEELQKHLEATTGGAGAFNQAVRLVRAIWQWAAKPPRKWTDLEAVEHLENEDSVSGEIGVLSAKQAQAVLRAAETHLPEAVPAFAIALFTGMRQAELERLKPKDITAEGITVPALNDRKNKRRRFIAMPEPLARWIKRYPIGERVTPPDWDRKEKAVRRLAGFGVSSDLVPRLPIKPRLKASPPPDLPKWPHNALRHTAATCAVAFGKPIEQLIFEHGHSGTLEMLRRHYVGALPKSEALKIWAIEPMPKAGSKAKKSHTTSKKHKPQLRIA
jgi:integrase